MPLVKINIRKGWTDKEKKALHDAIHNALVESLDIPDWDFFHRIYEFNDTDFIFPSGKSEKFMILEIHLYPGRSDEIKKRMHTILCDKVEELGVPRLDIFIQIIEQPLTNWGIRGGIPASEIS